VQQQMKFEIFFRAVTRFIQQAVSHWTLTAKARVHSRASQSEIYGGQNGSGTVVLRSFSVISIPPLLQVFSFKF
jgi:hypothetical protein